MELPLVSVQASRSFSNFNISEIKKKKKPITVLFLHIEVIKLLSFKGERKQTKALLISLSPADSEKVIHAFISSRLDDCNSLYFGTSQALLFS